jgi:hypothetical protein
MHPALFDCWLLEKWRAAGGALEERPPGQRRALHSGGEDDHGSDDHGGPGCCAADEEAQALASIQRWNAGNRRPAPEPQPQPQPQPVVPGGAQGGGDDGAVRSALQAAAAGMCEAEVEEVHMELCGMVWEELEGVQLSAAAQLGYTAQTWRAYRTHRPRRCLSAELTGDDRPEQCAAMRVMGLTPQRWDGLRPPPDPAAAGPGAGLGLVTSLGGEQDFNRPLLEKELTAEQRRAAVGTRAHVVKGVLSPADMAELDALYARIKAEALAAAAGEGEGQLEHPNLTGQCDDAHLTAFLHVHALIDRELPHVLRKVLAAMEQVDRTHWGLLSPGPGMQLQRPAGEGGGDAHEVDGAAAAAAAAGGADAAGVVGSGVRVMEYHEYRAGGQVSDPKHADDGSLVTMSVLLSEPAHDFEGGDFTTLEADEVTVTRYPTFRRGDGLVFVSEKWHSVQVVEAGTRCSLVTELWAGARVLAPSNRYAF